MNALSAGGEGERAGQLHMGSVWVRLRSHHWLINLQTHKWFESTFGPSLGLEQDSKNRCLQLKHLLAWSPTNLGLLSPGFRKTLRLLCLHHRMG